jgi:uncharacterized membrane protein YjjB (DUF3815 family)
MAHTATVITLSAGGLVFANEWLQTNQINWRIPIATLIGATLMDILANFNDRGATLFSVIVLIGAATTQFNGISAAQEISNTVNTTPSQGSSKIPESSPSERRV